MNRFYWKFAGWVVLIGAIMFVVLTLWSLIPAAWEWVG